MALNMKLYLIISERRYKMSDPFIGEIRMFAGNYAPRSWAFCDGQMLSIAQNTALFSLLGIYYGGNGQTTFALPDLRGRVPIHQGTGINMSGRTIGEIGGLEGIALVPNEMPRHTHTVNAQSKRGNTNDPTDAVWATSTLNQYDGNISGSKMMSGIISSSGLEQSHNNMMPLLGVSFIIALTGIFPSRN
jgi:microcystin-dependent protein